MASIICLGLLQKFLIGCEVTYTILIKGMTIALIGRYSLVILCIDLMDLYLLYSGFILPCDWLDGLFAPVIDRVGLFNCSDRSGRLVHRFDWLGGLFLCRNRRGAGYGANWFHMFITCNYSNESLHYTDGLPGFLHWCGWSAWLKSPLIDWEGLISTVIVLEGLFPPSDWSFPPYFSLCLGGADLTWW